MRALIIEDESLTARRLETLLQTLEPGMQIAAVLPSVAESVQWLRQHEAPDLVFMDIHLEDDLCFKIFELAPLKSPVIFTTAYDEYMIKAFKVNSVDYLLKPVNPEELKGALEKFHSIRQHQVTPDLDTLLRYIGQRTPEYKSRFMITVGSRIRSVEVAEIAYFYSQDKLTFLVTRDAQHLPIDFSLDKLTGLLDPAHFFRISRQYLVSFPAIQTVHAYYKGKYRLELNPKAKAEVFVSGDRMADFKEWLGR